MTGTARSVAPGSLTQAWLWGSAGGALLGWGGTLAHLGLLPAMAGMFVWARAFSRARDRGLSEALGVVAWGALTMHVAGIPWIWEGLARGGQNGPAVVALLGLLFLGAQVMVSTVSIALADGGLKRLGLQPPSRACASVWTLGWMLGEYVRQSGWVNFPYLRWGEMVADLPGGHGWLPVVGVEGHGSVVLFLVAFVACRWRGGRATPPVPVRRVVGLALGFGLSGGLLGHVVHWTEPLAAAPQTVVALQSNFTRATKWEEQAQQHALDLLVRAMRQAPVGSVVLTPELYFVEPAQVTPVTVIDRIKRMAAERHLHVVIGMPYAVKQGEGAPTAAQVPGAPALFNALVHFSPEREDIYAKAHLVPFGEYAPLASWLAPIYRDVFDFPLSNFSPAPALLQQSLFMNGLLAGPSICFEVAFPGIMARRARDAHWLFTVSNNAWFDSAVLNAQMDRMARLRAAEMGRPLVSLGNVGQSSVFDARGRPLAALPAGQEGTLAVPIRAHVGTTPYAWLSTWLPDLTGLLIAAGFIWGLGKPEKHHQQESR